MTGSFDCYVASMFSYSCGSYSIHASIFIAAFNFKKGKFDLRLAPWLNGYRRRLQSEKAWVRFLRESIFFLYSMDAMINEKSDGLM